MGFLEFAFIGFVIVVATSQLIPAAMVYTGMVKALFTQKGETK